MSNKLLALMMLGSALGGAGLPRRRNTKPTRKCRLKDCQKQTTHNGGYCCAEHHALAKESNE